MRRPTAKRGHANEAVELLEGGGGDGAPVDEIGLADDEDARVRAPFERRVPLPRRGFTVARLFASDELVDVDGKVLDDNSSSLPVTRNGGATPSSGPVLASMSARCKLVWVMTGFLLVLDGPMMLMAAKTLHPYQSKHRAGGPPVPHPRES